MRRLKMNTADLLDIDYVITCGGLGFSLLQITKSGLTTVYDYRILRNKPMEYARTKYLEQKLFQSNFIWEEKRKNR